MSDSNQNQEYSITKIQELTNEYFSIEANVKKLPGYEDLNYFLKATNGSEFILKIAHVGENQAELDMQNAAMLHLEKKGLDLTLPKVILNRDGEAITLIKDVKGQERCLRVLTWVPGRLMVKVKPHNPELLESLGVSCGKMCEGLKDLDHAAAHREHSWNSSKAFWLKDHFHLIEAGKKRELANYFFQLFEEEVALVLPNIRQSVIHNDANDYNILVDQDLANPKVSGFIDFGDMLCTNTVNEVAVAIAYAVMDKPDPLEAAAHIVRGFHSVFPLTESEIEILYTLVSMRLLTTVTSAAINRQKNPENEYLFVSERPAWGVLRKWREVSPSLAHYTFRYACGWEPCPKNPLFKKWGQSQKNSFAKVIDADFKKDSIRWLDLSVGSLDLGNNDEFDARSKFHKKVQGLLEEKGVDTGVGGYGEVRPFYSTESYLLMGNNGPRWRTVHLGQDIWVEAGTPVFAPLDGKVHSYKNNAGQSNYGPTIILEHEPTEELTFYTLYGHLSEDSLDWLDEGMPVQKGQQIAKIGAPPSNGNWSPHLHFQVQLDMLGMKGDFPGVAFPHEREVWLSICPDSAVFFVAEPNESDRQLSKQEILKTRGKNLGKSLSVSYSKPLKIVRGYMHYLYDDTGRPYLDTVNNVPHVGHQHPRVVEAARRQIGVLNTNTRYLHENIVRFAEELLETLPPELCVCHFVNSGSEANELALRMAQSFTGQKDMVVEEMGYHGNTGACIEISSYKFDRKGGSGAPDHIHVVPMPDTFRGQFRDPKTAGKQYAAFVQKAIEKVKEKAKGIAGFICETVLSCGGQIVLPEGYLKEAFAHVRAAGGLCIADEVQVGFGRVGDHFWGFELQDVVPDIVTMGKPIGNGHPLAAVLTTREVADAFANGMEYFNTFGGNPVSCAIGREVLSIIKEEGLQEHARKTGLYLTKGLKDLQLKYPIIGDVRGPGLFLGFELVKDMESRTPATKQASYLKNRMRDHGILMSTDGPFENVLKVKPPMCFDTSNADFLISMLDKVLGEDFIIGNKAI